MFARRIHILLSLLLFAFPVIGPGVTSPAFAQPSYGEDWRDRQNDREQGREEGRREEQQRQENERSRNQRNAPEHSSAQCNQQWDQCARYCNTIRNASDRMSCVAECNNNLHECQQQR